MKRELMPTGCRSAGVLLPVSALGGPGPIGSLDGAAVALRWMADAGFRFWQTLPIGPTDPSGSPYSSWSAWSGHPGLIGLRWLHQHGLGPQPRENASSLSDYGSELQAKLQLISWAARKLINETNHPFHGRFLNWEESNPWARDAAIFHAIRMQQLGKGWWQWPDELRDRNADALRRIEQQLDVTIRNWQAALFLFEVQWQETRELAGNLGIQVVGDLPIYVAWDSVDVWCHRERFQLDASGRPIEVAGCPPDAFSEDGQLWGNPLFEWPVHRKEAYRWWTARVQRQLDLFDGLRIDHFIGFSRYYAVPFSDKDARNGRWVDGPGRPLFEALKGALGGLPFWVEDLGEVDEATLALRDSLSLPGMVVFQFGWSGGDDNPHRPANYPERAIAYPGTHDNETLWGWWQGEGQTQRNLPSSSAPRVEVVDTLLNEVLSSRAGIAVIPAQDLLYLGSEARFNRPGTSEGNWAWRLSPGCFTAQRAQELRAWLGRVGRLLET